MDTKMIAHRGVSTLFLVALVALVATAGCSDPDDDLGNGNNIHTTDDTGNNSPNNTGNSNTDPGDVGPDADAGFDTGDGDTDPPDGDTGPDTDSDTTDPCEGVECGSGEVCSDGQCVGSPCETAEDLGELASSEQGEVYTATVDPSGEPDAMSLSCNDADAPEKVLSFQVDSAAKVDIALSGANGPMDVVMELRQGACDGEAVTCSDPETTQVFLEADTEYFLVVEPRFASTVGPVDVELTVESIVCVPGSRSCNAGDVELCDGGEQFISLACATDGCAGDVCEGDTCGNAIPVTETTTFQGDVNAYANEFDFSSKPSCAEIHNGEGLTSDGQDILFSLPGLKTGDVVTVDAGSGQSAGDDLNDNTLFIFETCSASPECLAANDTGDSLEYTVPADGDYFVVIDNYTASDKPFIYTIERPAQ